MASGISPRQFEQLWQKLQRLGLSTYEARAYLVLLGHPQFKAPELASRAAIPKQKIYDVLDKLVEKGLAVVAPGRTKLFAAVDPADAIPNLIARHRKAVEQELAQLTQLGTGLAEELRRLSHRGKAPQVGLQYVKIVMDPIQAGLRYRELLAQVCTQLEEFVCAPYAATPLEADLLEQARQRGVRCRLILEESTAEQLSDVLPALVRSGVELRIRATLPVKLALFDNRYGMCALRDPVVTRPGWTTMTFEHPGMLEVMHVIFEHYWAQARELA